MDKIFKNAVAVEVALEAVGIFGGHMVLAEVAVVAMCTTCILLWFVDRENKRNIAKMEKAVIRKLEQAKKGRA